MPPSASAPVVFPRLPLIGIGLAMLVAMGVAFAGPGLVGGTTPPPLAPVLAERTLTFVDRADHAVVVSDNGAEVAVFEGEQGFLRGVLRGLYRTRRGRDIPHEAPFHLAAYADGRMVLSDPSTGVRLDLAAFGPTNEKVFAGLLPPPPAPVGHAR